MEKLLISGCLIGNNTKYNGKNNYNPKIETLKNKYDFVVICPEVMGGMSIPRLPSEIIEETNSVVNSKGEDVSHYFNNGADIAANLALKHNIKKALLKDGSPSCGSSKIYDGTFTGRKVDGYGITTRRLKELDIKIYSEYEIDKL